MKHVLKCSKTYTKSYIKTIQNRIIATYTTPVPAHHSVFDSLKNDVKEKMM